MARIPKNVRFRKDQVAALMAMTDAETDCSTLVRKAVDRFLEKGNSSKETTKTVQQQPRRR